MLVLTRKEKQSIQIGDGIQVVITKIRGNTVQVGIEAPSDVSIVRSELTFRDNPNGPKSQSKAESKSGNLERSGDPQGSDSQSATTLPAPPASAEVHNRLKDEDFLGIRELPRLRIVRPIDQDSTPLGSFMKSH
jgi:carbon storage regulator CsrA